MVLKKSGPCRKIIKKRWDKFVNPALNNALKQEEATWGNVPRSSFTSIDGNWY